MMTNDAEQEIMERDETRFFGVKLEDMPALRVLVVALAGSKFLARSKLVSSRPSLSSGMTIVAFSLHIET